jgi:type IV secretory pathway TraG/TraD family ATPase VirD4
LLCYFVTLPNVKSLKFLNDTDKGNGFSIKSYTKGVNEGKKSWLFLATDPSSRELTTPLNASILELFISHMRKTRTKPINKLWIVMDELPSLGKLPSISQLMAEGRKYGACVLAGVQSTSQLYHHYGDAESSTLIGLFKTKFAFASDDPRMGELYSKLCGRKTTISQQKNTSFGANEFRDGVSYNERSEQSPLIPYEDFAKLSIGECYVILPEISARVAKIQTPEAKIKDKNDWFMELPEENSEEAAKTANSKIEGSATKVTKGAKRTKPTSSKKKGSSSSTNTQSSSGAAHESLPQPPKVIEALIPKTQAKELKKVGAKNVQSESKDKVKSKEKVNKEQKVSHAVEFD